LIKALEGGSVVAVSKPPLLDIEIDSENPINKLGKSSDTEADSAGEQFARDSRIYNQKGHDLLTVPTFSF
jgi:hypothetical protein